MQWFPLALGGIPRRLWGRATGGAQSDHWAARPGDKSGDMSGRHDRCSRRTSGGRPVYDDMAAQQTPVTPDWSRRPTAARPDRWPILGVRRRSPKWRIKDFRLVILSGARRRRVVSVWVGRGEGQLITDKHRQVVIWGPRQTKRNITFCILPSIDYHFVVACQIEASSSNTFIASHRSRKDRTFPSSHSVAKGIAVW